MAAVYSPTDSINTLALPCPNSSPLTVLKVLEGFSIWFWKALLVARKTDRTANAPSLLLVPAQAPWRSSSGGHEATAWLSQEPRPGLTAWQRGVQTPQNPHQFPPTSRDIDCGPLCSQSVCSTLDRLPPSSPCARGSTQNTAQTTWCPHTERVVLRVSITATSPSELIHTTARTKESHRTY